MMRDTGASVCVCGGAQLALSSASLCKADPGGTGRTKPEMQAAWRKAHGLQETQGIASDLGCYVYACMTCDCVWGEGWGRVPA